MTNTWCALVHGDRIIDSKLCVDTIDVSANCLEGNGGPLTAIVNGRHSVIGIGSVWETLCTSGHHGIFTRVSSFADWINGIVN